MFRSFEKIDSLTPYPVVQEWCNTFVDTPNMSTDDWQSKPETFLYKLYIEELYDEKNQGQYSVSIEDGKIISGAGSCRLHDSDYMILGHRGYTSPGKRNRENYKFLQHQTLKGWDLYQRYYQGYILSFNENNLTYADKYVRLNTVTKDTTQSRGLFRNKGRIIMPMEKHPDLLKINFTPQVVLYGGDHTGGLRKYLDTLKIV